FCFFYYHHAATTGIYTLSLHDALPILWVPALAALGRDDNHARGGLNGWGRNACPTRPPRRSRPTIRTSKKASLPISSVRRRIARDRKSTRLNSSHSQISYAVFCLKKKI